jgi:hypothetical protein
VLTQLQQYNHGKPSGRYKKRRKYNPPCTNLSFAR